MRLDAELTSAFKYRLYAHKQISVGISFARNIIYLELIYYSIYEWPLYENTVEIDLALGFICERT